MSKFTGGKGGGVVSTQSLKTSLMWLVVGILTLIILVVVIIKINTEPSTTDNRETRVNGKAEPVWTYVSLSTNLIPWVEIEEGFKIKGFMLADNLYWEIRVVYAGEPDKEYLYPQNPRNSLDASYMKFKPDVRIVKMRWRITPPDLAAGIHQKPGIPLEGKLKYKLIPIPEEESNIVTVPCTAQ